MHGLEQANISWRIYFPDFVTSPFFPFESSQFLTHEASGGDQMILFCPDA